MQMDQIVSLSLKIRLIVTPIFCCIIYVTKTYCIHWKIIRKWLSKGLSSVICNFVVSNFIIFHHSQAILSDYLSEMSVFSIIKTFCPDRVQFWLVHDRFKRVLTCFNPRDFGFNNLQMFYQTVYYLINGLGIFWHGNFGRILGIFLLLSGTRLW